MDFYLYFMCSKKTLIINNSNIFYPYVFLIDLIIISIKYIIAIKLNDLWIEYSTTFSYFKGSKNKLKSFKRAKLVNKRRDLAFSNRFSTVSPLRSVWRLSRQLRCILHAFT